MPKETNPKQTRKQRWENVGPILAVILCLYISRASGESPTPGKLHLRVGVLHVESEPEWHQLDRRKESLLQLPMADPQWGPVLGAEQFLVSTGVFLDSEIQQTIGVVLEKHGGHVINYIPDHALLILGSEDAAKEVGKLPGVAWVGHFRPEYKIAPEWGPVLEAVKNEDHLEHLLAGGTLDALSDNSSTTQEGLFGSLHIDTTGPRPRLVIEVQFPQILVEKSETLLYKPAIAAAADWMVEIKEKFGGAVDLKPEHGTLQVLILPEMLESLLDLLSHQPSVHWLHPQTRLNLHNWRASGIIQSGQAPPEEMSEESPEIHPIWAAGIRGQGQVVGCGDSGIDVDSCFFYDPSVGFEDGIQFSENGGWKFFESETHRKVRFYQGIYDLVDKNGHGSHVVGSILGDPYFGTDSKANANRGMAPEAKVAFMDLGGDDTRSIFTPRDLSVFYYPHTYKAGARIHSDSWGSDSPGYDVLSIEVDKFAWENQDFLPVFAAGNYGELSHKYITTVTSPAIAKNCLSVGASLSADQSLSTRRGQRVEAYEILVETDIPDGETDSRSYKILQGAFGGQWASLIRSSGDGISFVAGNPRRGCTPLTGVVSNSIVLLERGDCTFVTKMRHAQNRGALGVIVTNNIQQGYFEMAAASNMTTEDIGIPVGSVPIGIGRHLWHILTSKRSVKIKVMERTEPKHAYDNIADFSSSGPTPDQRVKPDIVAPGRIKSVWSDGGFSASKGQCKLITMSGTSMATPIVAGAAALVRQYFTDGYYPRGEKASDHKFEPSAALVKAALLGGAFPMDGFTDQGLPLEPPPSFRQGFGRVHLERSLPVKLSSYWKKGWRMQVVDGAELSSGESHEYCVKALGGPLRVTLVWTDPPPAQSVRKALVNDLDLVVRSAGLRGDVLLGNGVEDRVNNVEQVSMEDIPEGNVAIIVKGHFVLDAKGPQKYALVVHGRFNGILQSKHNPVADPKAVAKACVITLAVITNGPEGPTKVNSPEFAFTTESGVKPLDGFECQLANADGNTDGAQLHDWMQCSSPQKYDDLPDNGYQFSVRPAGEDVIVSQSFVVDTLAPQAKIFGTPVPPVSAKEVVEFEFAAVDASDVTFECKLEFEGLHSDWLRPKSPDTKVMLGEFVECVSPQVFHGLSFGEWSFSVRGKDSAGNEQEVPDVQKWRTQFQPNQYFVRTLEGPLDLVAASVLKFSLQAMQGMEDGSPALISVPLQCSMQPKTEQGFAEPVWSPCDSNTTYRDVADGVYKFLARTVDPKGHAQESISEVEVEIDSTPPIVSITQRPDEFHGANTVRIKFESTEEVARFNCSLVGKGEESAFEECGSLEGEAEYMLEDGWYAFQVLAEDLAGNMGRSEMIEFMVDSEPPLVVLEVPKPTNNSRVQIDFQVIDNGGSGVVPQNISCLLRNESREVGPEWEPSCTSPVIYNLTEGRYVMKIRAVDRAGLHNEPEDHAIIVDFTPPIARIVGSPPLGAQPPFVAFRFGGRDPNEKIASAVGFYECKLDMITVYPTAQQDVKSSEEMSVNGREDGNVDTAKPRSPPEGLDVSQIQIKDGADVALGEWVRCESPAVLTQMPTGHYSFRARAIDEAGNVGEATDRVVFEVDDTLPIPGESDSKESPQYEKWVWIAVVITAVGCVILVVFAVFCCRSRARGRHRRRARPYRNPAYAYRGRHPAHPSPSVINPLPTASSQEISSGGSEDPMLSATIKASLQQQEEDAERRMRMAQHMDDSRMQAAMEASIEEYRIQQAVNRSLQEDAWGQGVYGEPSAPPPPLSDLTSTSPWAGPSDVAQYPQWSSANYQQGLYRPS